MTFKSVVNEVLRKGLSAGDKPSPNRPAFVVNAARRGFRAGVDLQRLNQLVDELEVDAFMRESHEPERDTGN